MLNLNINEKRPLEFEVNIQGIDYKLLEGSFQVVVDDVTYGFPVEIHPDNLVANIPKLEQVIKRPLKNNEILEAKLVIYGDGFFLNPWSGQCQVTSPVKMEALIKEDKSTAVKVTIKEPTISTEKKTTTKTKALNENEKQKLLKQLLEKKKLLLALKEEKKQIIEYVESKPKKIQERLTRRLNSSSSTKEKSDPILLMESFGMKNPKIQKAMIERAKEIGGDHNITDTIKSMLLGQKNNNPYSYFDKKSKENINE